VCSNGKTNLFTVALCQDQELMERFKHKDVDAAADAVLDTDSADSDHTDSSDDSSHSAAL